MDHSAVSAEVALPLLNQRLPDADTDAQFYERWSPRSLSRRPVCPLSLLSLLEAARWAPSCFNEQPWMFYYALSAEAKASFLDCLVEKNRLWAAQAPVLLFLTYRRFFQQTGKENSHAFFDCGAAWQNFALQARHHGLFAHAMAGFDHKRVYALLQLAPEQFGIAAAIAVGYRAAPEALPADLRVLEQPNARKPLTDCAREFTPYL